MSLDLDADITGLRGAEYNPRHIDQEDLDALAESIRTLGLVKPLIVRGDLLVAGHQRTRALRHMGVARAPVFRLSAETTVYDEIRFNQLHNGTDLDGGDEACRISCGFDAAGWHVVGPDRISGNLRAKLAVVRNEICSLIARFGPWGGVVATRRGEVIHAAQYALAALATRTPLTVCVIEDDKVSAAREKLSRTYGVFSYARLERQTYIQTLAQMKRLRGGPSGKENRSTLYETMVIPHALARPGARGIDFGSGQGDYAAAMRRRGIDLHDVELFRRVAGGLKLDTLAINRMITRMAGDLASRGPYDFVVCDSVMNSVDCLEAQSAVLTVLNMLAGIGGPVFFSGRPREGQDKTASYTKAARAGQRYVEFLDRDGFTALFREGRWFYQKYHTRDDVRRLAADHGFEIVRHVHGSCSWQVQARKVRELDPDQVLRACNYEFDMQLGDDRRLGRHGDVNAAVAAMRQRSSSAIMAPN